jgi:predicted MPP superfamily phosphohydrolase
MHVGRGLAGQHPLRFFCKPEVTRIILRTGKPGPSQYFQG